MRRTTLPNLTVIYWRDIPSQVVATDSRRERQGILLSDRFQQAIDRAAMHSESSGTDAYVDGWRKLVTDGYGDPGEAAADLERLYPADRLTDLVARGGIETS